IENHIEFAKAYANKNGLELSIEPYDMNPAGDLDLGDVADVIMAEFWSKRFGYDTHYAVIEAASISHVSGKPIVGAEVFTSNSNELWQEYPWSMKDQSDWALSLGVNRFIFHTFAHKPLGDQYRPGMTMGPYGVHWDRGQTWWPMIEAYHKYISRCSYIMQQGKAVADILYLTPEGAPMVFNPPSDALTENGNIPDQNGYRFDGCSPKMLIDKAKVENGKIIFPNASSYEIMVLPNYKTMTPQLLMKIIFLVESGAKIIGSPPIKSPSLTDYPNCDNGITNLSKQLWGTLNIPDTICKRTYGKGEVFWGGDLSLSNNDLLYPSYENTVKILSQLNIHEDFTSSNNTIRFAHKKTEDMDIYFISNRTDSLQSTVCTFRTIGEPELWFGTNGEIRKISEYSVRDGKTQIPIEFFPYESFFVTFSKKNVWDTKSHVENKNFPSFKNLLTLNGSWDVSFDPKFGGPEKIKFETLYDWTDHKNRGIKYYSGIAKYSKKFNLSAETINEKKLFLDLGTVNDIARIKLNGKDIGVIWCAPWRIDISDAVVLGENDIKIEVANRWINRLLGDKQPADANVRKVKFENGFLGSKEFLTGRYTFTIEEAMKSFKFEKPLSSGLLGPVTIQQKSN
ncbi:MAG: glycosyl hydrolase, partial [Ignavibacteriae bacterium]|nr:glycosyl hydrolase [Ignavibacteriota bacterium]